MLLVLLVLISSATAHLPWQRRNMDVTRIDLAVMRKTTECTECLRADIVKAVDDRLIIGGTSALRWHGRRLQDLEGRELQVALDDNFSVLKHCASLKVWIEAIGKAPDPEKAYSLAMEELQLDDPTYVPQSYEVFQTEEGKDNLFRHLRNRVRKILTDANGLLQKFGILASLLLESLPLTYRMEDIADVLKAVGALAPPRSGSTREAAHRISRTATDVALMFQAPGYAAFVGYRHANYRPQFYGEKYAGKFVEDVNPPINQLGLVFTSLTFSLGVIHSLENGWLSYNCITPSARFVNWLVQLRYGNHLTCNKAESDLWIKSWAILGSLMGIDSRWNPTDRESAEALLEKILASEYYTSGVLDDAQGELMDHFVRTMRESNVVLGEGREAEEVRVTDRSTWKNWELTFARFNYYGVKQSCPYGGVFEAEAKIAKEGLDTRIPTEPDPYAFSKGYDIGEVEELIDQEVVVPKKGPEVPKKDEGPKEKEKDQDKMEFQEKEERVTMGHHRRKNLERKFQH